MTAWAAPRRAAGRSSWAVVTPPNPAAAANAPIAIPRLERPPDAGAGAPSPPLLRTVHILYLRRIPDPAVPVSPPADPAPRPNPTPRRDCPVPPLRQTGGVG